MKNLPDNNAGVSLPENRRPPMWVIRARGFDTRAAHDSAQAEARRAIALFASELSSRMASDTTKEA